MTFRLGDVDVELGPFSDSDGPPAAVAWSFPVDVEPDPRQMLVVSAAGVAAQWLTAVTFVVIGVVLPINKWAWAGLLLGAVLGAIGGALELRSSGDPDDANDWSDGKFDPRGVGAPPCLGA